MSSSKATKRALSRMELTVLGLVSRGEPCTAYWIRRQFQGSPSSHFSGSAGALHGYDIPDEVRRDILDHAGIHKAGGNDIDANATARDFLRQ